MNSVFKPSCEDVSVCFVLQKTQSIYTRINFCFSHGKNSNLYSRDACCMELFGFDRAPFLGVFFFLLFLLF